MPVIIMSSFHSVTPFSLAFKHHIVQQPIFHHAHTSCLSPAPANTHFHCSCWAVAMLLVSTSPSVLEVSTHPLPMVFLGSGDGGGDKLTSNWLSVASSGLWGCGTSGQGPGKASMSAHSPRLPHPATHLPLAVGCSQDCCLILPQRSL